MNKAPPRWPAISRERLESTPNRVLFKDLLGGQEPVQRLTPGRTNSVGRPHRAPSIDDLVRELLHPMLQLWFDQNLPRLVERLVREEIELAQRKPSVTS